MTFIKNDYISNSCKTQKYYETLPTASIVVPFFNEHLSVLLRTAYSALNRAPPNLIEVILVDDASTKGNSLYLASKIYIHNILPFEIEHTKEELDNFVRNHLPKVRVIHLSGSMIVVLLFILITTIVY